MHNTIQQSQTGRNTRSVFWLRLWIGFLIYILGGFPTLVFALPQDGQVVSGEATISQTATDMVVHQSTDKLITNWQSFNIDGHESVEFKQPSASSVALNNVIGLSPSLILGNLTSNGQVFLSNGSGIIFGKDSQVNVGGLLATTLSIKNQDFLSGNYNFAQDPSRPLSSVVNHGLINASSYVGLLAPVVENTGIKEENRGIVVANMGSVAMASGKAASLDFVGDGLINFAITEGVDGDVLDAEGNAIDHRVKNSGFVQANGGRVVLSAKDAGNIIQNVVNNTGVIEAHSAVERNGEIFLMGGDSGVVANSGTLDASGKESGQTGGTVHMVGEKVGVFGEGVVDVSGNTGGGTALIGGDVQGGGDVQTASNTYVSEDATITADAIESGDGGRVVVWADDTTRIYGSVSATGGAVSGDGGFVETSGKNFLEITRAADVTAAFGLGGEWLIDPRDITIVAGSGNVGINGSDPFVSTADSSVLGVNLIVAALTGGANVTITTGSDGAQAGDITLNVDLDFNGTGANTLSFIAHNDIILNNSIFDSSVGGDTLNLVFTADSDLSGSGTLVVGAAASVASQGGSMQITARDVDFQGTLDAGAGDITIAIAQQVAGTGEIQVGDDIYCPTCAMVVSSQELENITAANLTVENSTDAIYVTGISAANSNNIGTVILDANGNIEFGRDAIDQTFASTFNALRVLSDAEVRITANLTADAGDMEITADADGNNGAGDKLTFLGSPDLTATGDITLSAATSAGITSEVHVDMISGGTITVTGDWVGGKRLTFSADNGIVLNSDLTAGQGIFLNGDANGLVDGNDTITLADDITFDSTAGGGHIDFLSKVNALGAFTVNAGDRIKIDADFTSAGVTTFNAAAFSGSVFSVASGATLNTNGNTLNVQAIDLDLQGSIDVGSADFNLTVTQRGSSFNRIQLGGATCTTCTMLISGDELQKITAGTFSVLNTKDIIVVNGVSAANSANIGTVVLTSERHLSFTGGNSTFNALIANAKTDIEVLTHVSTLVGDLVLNADSDSTGGADRIFLAANPTLTSAGNLSLNIFSGAAGISSTGSVVLTSGGTITLGDDIVVGNELTMNAENGINVNGNLTAVGNVALNGDTNSSADGNDTITFAAGTTIESTGGTLTLDRSVALGAITLNAKEGLTLNGDFTSNGLTAIDADSNSGFGTGTFTIASGAALNTNNNALTIHAQGVDLQGTINVGGSDITLTVAQSATSFNRIQIGGTACALCTMDISGAELQNITAGTLNITNSKELIVVDGITAANSNNIGTVVLTSARHISFSGGASTFNALTANAKTDVEVLASLTTDTGDLILNADSDSSGGSDRILIMSSPTLTSAGDILMDVSASGIVVNGSVAMVAGGTITLNQGLTATVNATLSADNGINLNGGLTASGNIALNGDANSSVDGNDTIAFVSGATIQSTGGSITIGSAASALGGISVLAANGININGAFVSQGATVINSDSDANGVGTLTVAGSVTTNNNTLSVTADDINLTGTLNAGLSDVTILVSDNGTIGLGGTAGGMTIGGAELQNISAANLILGNTSNGNVTVDGITSGNSENIGTVTLNSGGDVDFSNNDSVFNALNVNAVTDINVNTNLETDTGDFVAVADFENNNVGDFNLGVGNTLTSADNIDLTGENVNLNGNLIAGGTITINGVLGGGSPILIQAADGVTITQDVINFGAVTIDADSDRNGVGNFEIVAGKIIKSFNNNISITANDFIIDGTINAGAGTLTLLSSVAGSTIGLGNAAGTIQISGAELQNLTAANLVVGSSLNSGVAVDGVTASDLSNIGSVALSSGSDINFNNNDSTFDALTLDAGGSINTTAANIIATALTTSSVTGTNISTQVNSLDFSNSGSGDVTVNNSGALSLNGTNSAGNLSVTTSGDVTQSGGLIVSGTTNVNAAGSNVTLNDSANDFTGAVSVTGNNVAITDLSALDLGVLTVAGNLVVSAGGAVTDSGVLAVIGTTSISAGAFDINLDNAANDFTGSVSVTGANVNLVDSDGITLGTSTITGALTVTAVEGVTIDGAVSTAGLTTINADSDDNGFGNFSVTATGSLLTNGSDLDIAARDLDLLGTINVGAGNIVLTGSGVGQAVVGDNTTCVSCAMQISGSELENITAGSLTLNNNAEAIFIDNVSAANSDNIGTVIFNAGRHVAFRGNASTFNAVTANAKTDIEAQVDVTTDTGDLVFNADTDSTGGFDRIFIVSNSTLTSAADLKLTSLGSAGIFASSSATLISTGSITIDGWVNVNGSAAFTAGGSITLNHDFTSGGNATLNADDGINVNGDMTVVGDINLNGDANSSADGNDTITFATGATIASTGGTVTLDRSVALGAITLNAKEGLTLNGDFTSNGLTTFDADSNSGFGVGTFTIASGAALNTNNNQLTIHAQDVDLQGTINVGGSDITLTVAQSAGSFNRIQLGGTACALCTMDISGAELENITAGTLNIENSKEQIVVNGITAANSNNIGTVNLNSGRHITFKGNASTFNALTANAKTDVEILTHVSTDVGDLILNADTDSSGGADRIFMASNPTLTSAGDLSLNISSGASGISSSGSVTLVSGGTLTLGDDAIIGGDAILSANNGINVNGNLLAVGSIDLNGDQNGLADGNDTITFANGISVESLTTTVSLNSAVNALGSITIEAANGIDVNDTFTSNGITTFNADSNTNGLGDFNLSGSINTNNKSLHITANDLDLQGAVNSGNATTILKISDGGTIGIGNAVGDLTLDGDELQNITAAYLVVGSTFNSGITVDGVTSVDSANFNGITVQSGGDINFSGAASTFKSLVATVATTSNGGINVDAAISTTTGRLNLSSNGNINLNANVTSATTSIMTTGGSVSTTAATITASKLTVNSRAGIDISTDVDQLAFTNTFSGNVAVNNVGALSLFGSNNVGNLSVTTGGAITQFGVVSVGGTTSLDAGTFNVTLNDAGNDFVGTVSVTGANVSITDINALDLGTSTVTGNLNVTTGGDITDSGTVAVAGNLTATTTANNGSITLDGLAVAGTIGLATNGTGNATVVNAAGLDLAASSIGGNFSGTAATGDITQTGALAVAGTSSFNTTAANADITLGNIANSLVGTVSVNTTGPSGDVTIDNGTTALDIGLSSVGGNLTLVSGNAAGITDSGTVTVGGNLSATTDTGNGSITLDTLAVAGTIGLATNGTGNATVVNATGLDLAASSIGGNFSGTAVTGDITQSGAMTVAGASSFTVANGQDISLWWANDFAGPISFSASSGNISDVYLKDISAVDLAALTLTGNLTVVTDGAVTQSGALTIAGVADFSSDSDITLDNASNDFIGSVAFHSGGNVTVVDVNDIALGSTGMAGNFIMTAGGAITQSGTTLGVTGNATITANGDITLDAANIFNGTVSLTGANVTLSALTAIDLGDSTATGDFSVTSEHWGITDSGVLSVGGASSFTAANGRDIILDNNSNNFGGPVSFGAVTGTLANVTIVDTTALDLSSLTLTGNLSVTAGGAVTDSGTLVVGGTTTISATGNDVTLDDAANNFTDAVSVNGANVTLVDQNAIDLGTSTVTGALTVVAGGAVTDSGTLNVIGTTTISAAGQNVILDSTTNDFTGAVSVNGVNVAITDVNDLDLGTSTITGTLRLNSGGSITQSGALNVSGGATMVATQDVTLTNAANDFAGIHFTANNVSVVDSNGFVIGKGADLFNFTPTIISGNLSLVAGGAVTQDGGFSAIEIGGTTDINASGFNITLNGLGNKFGGAISVTGHNVQLAGYSSDIILGASTVTGDLAVYTFENISQTGALNIAGTTTVQGVEIILDNAANDFQGTVGMHPLTNVVNNVTLVDINSIDLGVMNLDGNLSVTAGGTVNNSGALAVVGTTTVNAAGHNVFLNNIANDFGGAVSVDGAFAALFDVNDLELGASNISGASIIANGNLTQSGAFNASGSVSISAQDITLTDAANDFQGTVFVTGNNVSLTDINAIEFGDSTINGDFMLTAGGDVTQTFIAPPPPPFPVLFPPFVLPTGSTITVAGTTMINAAGDVTLNNDTNDFGGEVGVNAVNVKLADINSITLKDSTLTGDLRVDANDGIAINGSVSTGASSTPYGPGAIFNADYDGNGSGIFSVTAAGSVVTDDNGLRITADDVDLQGTLNAGTSSVSIRISDAGTIGLGNATGDLTLDGSELENITAAYLGLSGTPSPFPFSLPTNGDISVDGVTAANTQNIGFVSLKTGSDINFVNNDSVFDALSLNAANDININTNVETTSGVFHAIADGDANGTGTFTVAATGSVFTNDHSLTVIASDIDLAGTLNSGLADTGIWITTGGTIGLGNTAGDMTIDGSELQNITAANLFLGSTTELEFTSFSGSIIATGGLLGGFATGDITVDGITAANSQNIGTVTLASGGNIHFENNDSVFNALNVHAVTDINVNTNLETDTGSFEAIADFELNNIGDFNLGTGNTITSALDIDITAENVNLNGNLDAGGTITINGEIFADEEIFINAVDGVIITEDINNNEAITIDADTNRDGIGDFELVGGVMIKSNDYNISITANDFIIDGIIDAGLGNVTLISSVGGTIGVGDAWGNIRIDNSELQNISAGNLIIGDEKNSNVYVKNVQANDVANIAELTLNATKWGKSVVFYGPASSLNNLTANASNDVLVYGGLTAKDTSFNAGDDVKLWGGNYSFDSLTAVADDDLIIYGTLNATNADYSAGDDIWLDGYQTYGVLNATAGDDIFIDWELTAGTANLVSGDDTDIRGTTRFGDLTINAGDDISVRGDHETTGTANFTAGDDVTMRNNLSFGDLNVVAGDYISVYATLGASNAKYAAGGDIWLDGYQTYGDLKATAGDDITIDWELTAATAKLTAGDDVYISGTTRFGNLKVNAGDDISVRGNQQTTGKATLTAGDDIYLNGYNVFGKLIANAGRDFDAHGLVDVNGRATLNAGNDIDVHGTFSVDGKGTFNAGDDIHLHGYNTFKSLVMDAGDDISVKGTLAVTNKGTLNADGDINLNGYNSFGKLVATAGHDIDAHGLLNVDGKATLNAGNDIDVHGTFVTGGKANLNADDDIHLHGYNTFDKLTMNAGDDISVKGILAVTNKGTMNAGGNVDLDGYNSFGKLLVNAGYDIDVHGLLDVDDKATLNAGNDIDVHGTFVTGGKANLNSGDDIHLHGYNSFGSLEASAWDDINTNGVISVAGNGNLNAGDDINLRGYNTFDKLNISANGDVDAQGFIGVTNNATLNAGNDIDVHGTFVVGGKGTLNASDDIHLHGYNSFDKLTANSIGDIDIRGALNVAGKASLAAGDDIQINGYFSSAKWTAVAGDDIRLSGYYNVSSANLKADDEIRIDRAYINSGDFTAEADFDNNGSGAMRLEKHSSINSTGDIDLSGYGLSIKGNLSAAGTVSLTDKSE